MEISDWVLVGTTIFLGAIAIFSTYLAEMVKRKLFAPKMEVKFDPDLPFRIKTSFTSPDNPELNEPVFFFYFQLENEGKSQARLCEIWLEELWIYDASERPLKYQNFLPVDLSTETQNINPHRKLLVTIGHISSPTYQAKYESKSFIDIPGVNNDGLKFMLSHKYFTNLQPNCLGPGKYGIKVSIYAENISRKEVYFKIAWSGNWQSAEENMLRELVIYRVERL